MTELNPAEQAAADALWDHWTPIDGDPELTIESFYDEARAVVAAIRPLLEAEALRAEADSLEGAVEDVMPTMFVVPAHIWLRDRADSRRRAADRQAEGSGT